MNVEQGIIETLEDRCSTLGFLARIYMGELPAPLLESILVEMQSPAPEGDPETPGQRGLRSFAESVRSDPIQMVATDLAAEYVSMFFSSWKRTLSPFESVYRSPAHAMMQKASTEIERLYAEAGMQLDEGFTEPPDHIAAELAFMAHLCRDSLAAAKAGDPGATLRSLQAQEQFLQSHLLLWAPEFCADLGKLTHSEFYRSIALLTTEFLTMEAEMIQELIASLATHSAQA